MKKIYLDNNIYRLLNKDENKDIKNLLENSLNKEVIILYSQAHINDLHRDKTTKKYEDLKFMDLFVEDNFLVYETEKDSINNILIRPQEAYEFYKPDVDSFENFMSSTIDELRDDLEIEHIVSPLLNILETTQIDLGLTTVSKEQDPKNIIERLGLRNNPKSMLDWMSMFGRMIDRLYSDNSIIKDVRSSSKNLLQVEKFKVNINEIDFNKKLSETRLGMSYNELLEKTFENISNTEQKSIKYTKLTMAFSMLNFLGLDKEKNKKVKYLNTHHDSEHFFYGSIADWIISDDKGFINKSKFLVNLFNLDLEILNFDQFKGKLKLLIKTSKITAGRLITDITHEFKNGLILNSRLSVEKLQKITIIKPRITFLEFFNRISYVEMTDGSNASYIILYKDGRSTYHFNWFKDFKRMTNKLIEIFGIDDFGMGRYSEKDQRDIESGKWYGREWNFDKSQILLSKNMDTNRLNLIIGSSELK